MNADLADALVRSSDAGSPFAIPTMHRTSTTGSETDVVACVGDGYALCIDDSSHDDCSILAVGSYISARIILA